jgi:16S rRNA C1402 N4-methylase RsmH
MPPSDADPALAPHGAPAGAAREGGEALVKILTRRPVLPGEEEQRLNSRSRSAKLRVVERL